MQRSALQARGNLCKKARQSKAKQSKAKQSKAKQSKAKQSKAKTSKAKQSQAKPSQAKPYIILAHLLPVRINKVMHDDIVSSCSALHSKVD